MDSSDNMPKDKKTAKKGKAASGGLFRFGKMAQHLADIMPLGMVAFDSEMNITDCNPSANKMLAIGGDITKVFNTGSAPPDENCWENQLRHALERAEPSTFENIIYTQNGSVSTLHIICTPINDEKTGLQTGGLLLIEDVTAKAIMERDLASAERLAAVGKLAARVAHELNNPLDGILRYINLTKRVIEKNKLTQASGYLEESRKGLLRMVKIISKLLEFSRSTYSSFEEADINKIVEDAVKAMESMASDNKVEIVRQYDPDMPNIRSGNLFQVFCNLIKNAVDAMGRGGELHIQTCFNPDSVLIEFADTGTGFDSAIGEQLFEPFFTTKEAGKGTGLGLAICKDIIERYNGTIHAENRPTGGSIFTVSIPLERTLWQEKRQDAGHRAQVK